MKRISLLALGILLISALAYGASFKNTFFPVTSGGSLSAASDAQAQNKTTTTVYLTPGNLAALDANASQTGLIRPSSDTESLLGTSTSVAVTPNSLTAALANSTKAGVARFATLEEMTNGTLSNVIATPYGVNATIHNATASNSTSGIVQFAPVGNSTDWTKALSPGAFFATPRYYTGSSTRTAASGNGTQNITGWGFTPGFIEVQCSAGIGTWSLGYYDGTNQGSTVAFASGTSTLFGVGGAGYAINLYNAGNTYGTIARTADGFNITWNIATGDWSGTTFTVRYKISR